MKHYSAILTANAIKYSVILFKQLEFKSYEVTTRRGPKKDYGPKSEYDLTQNLDED